MKRLSSPLTFGVIALLFIIGIIFRRDRPSRHFSRYEMVLIPLV